MNKSLADLLEIAGGLPILKGKKHIVYDEYLKNGVVICPSCGTEYPNWTPKYCTECKKRLVKELQD